MARETRSESLVKIANLKYEFEKKLSKIEKNDPGIRLTKQGLIFSSSKGLDYSGAIFGSGKHIEFELKETQRLALPMSDIRFSQIERMEELQHAGAETFLLVLFLKLNEWYRLNWNELDQALTINMRSLPLSYFRAFGFVVTNHEGFPRFLDPESHPLCNELRRNYEKPIQRRHVLPPLPKINHLDVEARKKRIENAIKRGSKNAEKRYIQVQVYKDKAKAKKYGMEE